MPLSERDLDAHNRDFGRDPRTKRDFAATAIADDWRADAAERQLRTLQPAEACTDVGAEQTPRLAPLRRPRIVGPRSARRWARVIVGGVLVLIVVAGSWHGVSRALAAQPIPAQEEVIDLARWL